MTRRVEALALDALGEGIATAVRVGSRNLVLIRWGERVFALRNVCPHQQAPLTGGFVHAGVLGGLRTGATEGGVDFTLDEGAPVLLCPRHHWEFRADTGACATDPRFRVRAYATTVQDGRVFVEL